jgi:transcriptional regulator with XRE-family HTH domain
MYTFPELLKNIREAGGLTQEGMAKALGVSTVLISMLETGQKEPSKGFVIKLADKLGVQPSSIMPFLVETGANGERLSSLEKALVGLGEKLQAYLIKTRSKRLRQYA